jgi:dihydroorotase/N-acyl-D-amino-acid deacylase
MYKKTFLILSCFFLINCESSSYDLVIKNGQVFDGSGTESKTVDIAITGNTIIKVGKINSEKSTRVIDASGLIVSPGFIDTHAHLDPMDNLIKLSDSESHVRQGVTTSFGGPDGRGVPLKYGFKQYLDTIEKVGVGMNMGFLTGHNKIRRVVMNLDNREPTNDELEIMKNLASKAMDEGAFGISTGLKYLPGNFSKVDEVIAISKEISSKGGIYTSHLRDEGLKIIDAVKEAILISKNADINVVLTHHKVIGKPMWGKSAITLSLIDSARQKGIKIMADQYPYNASHTGINILIPTWARAGGRNEFRKRVSNKTTKEKIKTEIEFNILNDRGGNDLSRVQFSRVAWMPELEGKTLKDWAVMRGIEPSVKNGAELVIEAELNGGASCIFHAMDESDVENIMKYPHTMIASDGRLSEPGVGHPHPRAYGTFPRVLGRYVREKKVISMSEAIYKMTYLPAKAFGLKNRGLIMKGMMADITIFDEEKIIDNATFESPHQYPDGIKYVIINGEFAVDNYEFMKIKAGKVLRKNQIN